MDPQINYKNVKSWSNLSYCLAVFHYSRTRLIRPPSESHWCGRIRGMVAREGFVYTQNALSVTRNVVVWEGWSLVRVVVRQEFYCITIFFSVFWRGGRKAEIQEWAVEVALPIEELRRRRLFLFDPKTVITRIHVTMIINNPGSVITEKNTWYNCNKKNRVRRLLLRLLLSLSRSQMRN